MKSIANQNTKLVCMMNTRVIKILQFFKIATIAEGISFLVLLFVAMPLKYYADFPEVVKYFGWIHGVLFIIYLALAFELGAQLNKGFGWLIKAFIAAVLPLGVFIFDKQIKVKESSK